MSYLVFARKFRPQNFEAVVGQEPIVTTLQNAIKQERIPQNFLFAGPRGCGKTSTARILAKAINCKNGPTENPCSKCDPCKEITEGNFLDVLEIDGASNRGIDEIRNLRETVKFKPVSGRMKIYIIDEVHMLTTEAFNALLKTLEEPPPHVKFIFATTEPHKVPLTILSRCHRFNFKRIPIKEIAGKLEVIAKTEKLKYEKDALFLIAKTSDGALRDAEGMLDQLASFADEKITQDDVLKMLGLASEEIYFQVLTALKEKNAEKIFAAVTELYQSGKDLVQFAKGLLETFRDLLLLQSAEKTAAFIERSDASLDELRKRKQDFSKEELLLALSFLSNLQNQMRRNLAPPKLLLEVVLLKLIHLEGYRSLDTLIQGKTPSSLPVRQAGLPSPPERGKGEQPKTKVEGVISQPAPGVSGSIISFQEVESVWPQVIEYVKTKRMSTGIFLSESQPVEIIECVLTLGLPTEFQFHKDMLEKGSNRQLIEEAFEVTLGKKLRVQFVVTKADQELKKQAAKMPVAPTENQPQSGKLAEIVTEALSVFEGAKIVRAE